MDEPKHTTADLIRKFLPAEAALSDVALLDRADRAYRLIRACEWSIELCEAAQEEAERDLVSAVCELVCRFLRRGLLSNGRPYGKLSNVGMTKAAERLLAAHGARVRATNRARDRLTFAREAWQSAAAEMVRRFLKPPSTAVELEGAGRSFRIWLDEAGEPIVAVARKARE